MSKNELDASDVFLMTLMLDSYMEPTRVGSDRVHAPYVHSRVHLTTTHTHAGKVYTVSTNGPRYHELTYSVFYKLIIISRT